MNRTFVIGDIHGAYRALEQCLDRSNFDPESDCLICLGDVCDGWPETRQCIERLHGLEHLIYLWGNHDVWAAEWMKSGMGDDLWLMQGGNATISSFPHGPSEDHLLFFEHARPYYLHDNKLFVHAGIIPDQSLETQSLQTFAWDRTLARKAKTLTNHGAQRLTTYDEIFIGHTPISEPHPVRYGEVWMMDTGAGWSGVLSMMNVDTKEVFVSDLVPDLYPGITGRQRW